MCQTSCESCSFWNFKKGIVCNGVREWIMFLIKNNIFEVVGNNIEIIIIKIYRKKIRIKTTLQQ
jgi:hypothetical protein